MTIRWLGDEATRRHSKMHPNEKKDKEKVQEVRKTRGGVILDPDDNIKDVLDDNDFVTVVVYGITTGFGKFARTVIDSDKLEELQYNLIRSHAAGVGTPLNPDKVLTAHGLTPMRLGPKEGIALINGTQLITSLGAEAVERAYYIARQADVVAALTLEVLKGTSRAFDSDVQLIRPHKGQIAVAKRLRALLHSDTYPSQIAAGNFHGEYPAKVLDYLAVAVHELASMSERRIERLVNPVSENKALCHPASVDSLSTSAGTEDHVSMGCFAARKALLVVENVEKVIAIELLAACQAIEFLRPLKTTVPLEEVYNVVRNVVRPLDKDRYMAPDITEVLNLLLEDKVWSAVHHHIAYYHAPEEVETRVFSPTAVMVGDKQRDRPHSESPSKKRRLE
ncbi:Histidine ammonia-lyase [Blattella germanica]|nr:Histidine ammonia-lyase [Blattella germanica]